MQIQLKNKLFKCGYFETKNLYTQQNKIYLKCIVLFVEIHYQLQRKYVTIVAMSSAHSQIIKMLKVLVVLAVLYH